METTMVYQKPSWRQYAIYFLLMLLALVILLYFWMGGNYLNAFAQFQVLEKLDYARMEAFVAVFKTLNERSTAPGFWLLTQERAVDKNKASTIMQDYPETMEMGILKEGKNYLSISTKAGNENIKADLLKSAAAYKDSAEIKKSNISVFNYQTGEGIMVGRYSTGIDGKDYGLYFFKKGDDTYITVNDYEVMKELLPEIMPGMKKYHGEIFSKYFDRYPDEFSAEVTFSDKDNQIFYTFGKTHGYEWKDDIWEKNYGEQLIPPYGWHIHLQISSGDKNLIEFAESKMQLKPGLWFFSSDWRRIAKLIIGALAILLLGHFSPWMHGFRKNRN